MKRLLIVLIVAVAVTCLFANGTEEKNEGQVTGIWEAYDPPITLTTARAIGLDTEFPEGQSYQKNVWYDEYLSELGIQVINSWEAEANNDGYKTKLNLSIAAQDIPDFFETSDSIQLQNLLDADMLEDLTDAYDNYASPLLKSLTEEDGGKMLDSGRVNGRLMALPKSIFRPYDPRMIFIRKDWRENLGLARPESMEDVLAISTAFTHNDPDGNGMDDTYGIPVNKSVLDEGFLDITGIANAYGAYPRLWLKDDKGKLKYGTIQPEMKDAVARLAEMFSNGEIDPEFVTKDGGALAQMLTSEKFGIMIGNFWLPSWPINSLYKEKGVDWEAFPVTGMNGADTYVQILRDGGITWVVKKGTANPEALIKMLNYHVEKLYGETADGEKYRKNGKYSMHMWGPVSYHGEIRVNLDQAVTVTRAIDTNDESILYNEEVRQTYDGVKRYLDAVKAGETPQASDWVLAKFFYGPTSAMMVLESYWESERYIQTEFYGAPTREMQRKFSMLKQMEEDTIIKIIMGLEPVSYFDQFVDEWKKLGGDKITEEVNTWYANTK